MYSRTIIVGRITADPELRQTQSGVSVTSFSVAVNRSYAPRGGERQTDFFDVVAWRNTAEFITRYFSKGSAILIEGSMESRTFVDKNGQNRRVWELIASNAHFVEGKSSSGGGYERAPAHAESSYSSGGPAPAPLPAFSAGSAEDFTEIDDDDDLPF